MSNEYGYIKTKQNGKETITISDLNGEPYSISSDQANFAAVLSAAKSGNWEDALSLISEAKAISTYTKGSFEVVRGQIQIDGRVVPTALADYILDFQRDGLDYLPLVRFAQNLFENPSKHSVAQLFNFLEKTKSPLTEDGCFLAYKRVAQNFKDIHSGTFDNSPGMSPEMPRAEVDDNPSMHCSNGLHVAAWNYAANNYHAGVGHMLMVKVHPRDVVSVPDDYNFEKMRCCKYEVLEVVKESLITRLTSSRGGELTAGNFEIEETNDIPVED
jgi:hypothetical protein